MFDNYREFEEIINNKFCGKIDFENLRCNPATILPLLCVCNNENLKLNNCENAGDYLSSILDKNPLFSRLPFSRDDSDDTEFITKYMKNLNHDYAGYFAMRIIISELVNNVYDHSRFGNDFLQSYIFSNIDEKTEKLDICVIDDGVSIPGLFEISNVDFDNDCWAIEKAIGVFSTVSDSQFERGNGLWTIIRLVAEGNGGELLLVSRKGCLHICGENYRYYLLGDEHIFNGTLVCVRLNKYEIQNIYDLIEFNKPNSYKLERIYDY